MTTIAKTAYSFNTTPDGLAVITNGRGYPLTYTLPELRDTLANIEARIADPDNKVNLSKRAGILRAAIAALEATPQVGGE